MEGILFELQNTYQELNSLKTEVELTCKVYEEAKKFLFEMSQDRNLSERYCNRCLELWSRM